MTRGLVGRTKIRLLANSLEEGEAYAKVIGADHLPPNLFEIAQVRHGDIWVRDTGPIWARDDNGDLAILWMGFNNWGYFPCPGNADASDTPNYIPRDLGAVMNVPVYRTPLIGEGGDKSFNGKGSLICCRAVERRRNPSLEFSTLEALLRSSFNVQQTISATPSGGRCTAFPASGSTARSGSAWPEATVISWSAMASCLCRNITSPARASSWIRSTRRRRT